MHAWWWGRPGIHGSAGVHRGSAPWAAPTDTPQTIPIFFRWLTLVSVHELRCDELKMQPAGWSAIGSWRLPLTPVFMFVRTAGRCLLVSGLVPRGFDFWFNGYFGQSFSVKPKHVKHTSVQAHCHMHVCEGRSRSTRCHCASSLTFFHGTSHACLRCQQ
jgi:hypothetical protein